MPPTKTIFVFLVRLVVIYAALVIPWPGLTDAYAALYRAGGNLLFRDFGGYGTVSFRPRCPPTRFFDTESVLTAPLPGGFKKWTLPVSSRYRGYVPTATLIALVLAMPLPWRRRLRALGWGLLLVNGFVVLRTALSLLQGFAGDAGAPGAAGPFWRAVLKCVVATLSETPASLFFVPILIWVLVSFRRDDWAPRVATPGPRASEGAAPAGHARSPRGGRDNSDRDRSWRL